MEIFLIILIITFLIIKIRAGMIRQRKILNIVYGKYTFDQLTETDREAIFIISCSILKNGGIVDAEERLNYLNDSQRYGIYALAMRELQIKPRGNNFFYWNYVINPMVISEKDKKYLDIEIKFFQKDHGVMLNLKTDNI